jgi:hypothetical protein
MQLIHQRSQPQTLGRAVFLVCVFRDEELLLDYFVRYYRKLGVTHFLFVDNSSVDAGPEFLMGLDDVNLWLYRTEDSYRDATQGTDWINRLLADHCVGEYCLVVDADELFMFDSSRYTDLNALVGEMEASGSNVVVTTLLDMYPRETNDSYQKGADFLTHSSLYDAWNAKYYREQGPIYKSMKHKVGGVRERVLGTTACIHKFPLFKFNFSPIGVAPGVHFFQRKGKVLLKSRKIRLHADPSLLLHFKFIKPNLKEFFQARIDNNQNWDNSVEYRSYSQAMEGKGKLEFYSPEYSVDFNKAGGLDGFFNLP